MSTKGKRTTASSTPGKMKGPNCKKSPLKVRLAKDTKFHKTDPKEFEKATREVYKLNGVNYNLI
jgi:hypothetical protein